MSRRDNFVLSKQNVSGLLAVTSILVSLRLALGDTVLHKLRLVVFKVFQLALRWCSGSVNVS